MAHVPGQVVAVLDDEWGTTCDNHDDRQAVKRICSEADSFGAEYMNFCQECWDEYQQGLKEKEEDPEQWDTCPECKKAAPRLISYRDMDEGMHGPVYEHCGECHSKMNARIAEEDAFYDNDDDYCPESDCDYDPEPNYEDLVESEFQIVADYLKRDYQLPFVVKKRDSKKTGDVELSLILEVKGNKAYKRVNKRFQSFINIGIDNGLIDVPELKGMICGTADDIDVSILNRRVSDRKIEYRKAKPAVGISDMIKLIKEGMRRRPSRNTTKHYVTPVYAIELILAKVYWS